MGRAIRFRRQMINQSNRRCTAWNHWWLPPSVDASRERFSSMTTDEEPGCRANEAPAASGITALSRNRSNAARSTDDIVHSVIVPMGGVRSIEGIVTEPPNLYKIKYGCLR